MQILSAMKQRDIQRPKMSKVLPTTQKLCHLRFFMLMVTKTGYLNLFRNPRTFLVQLYFRGSYGHYISLSCMHGPPIIPPDFSNKLVGTVGTKMIQ